MKKLICPRCGNTDSSLFYQGSKGLYCRACIRFLRYLLLEAKQEKWDDFPLDLDSDYDLDFNLTKAQKKVSDDICRYMEHKDVLVWAVTGAGKTELCMEFIRQCLKCRKRIGVVIARRQVVLELTERFRKAFHCEVNPICEGHTDVLTGDLIVLTAHQCYRFADKKFDHIIVDEPDAFPYYGNPVLQGIVRNSCRSTMLFLTATPDQKLLDSCQVLRLFSRPHGHDLPVPSTIRCLFLLSYPRLISWAVFRANHGYPFLIFAPTIKDAHRITFLLRRFIKVECCTSKTENKDEVIGKMRNREVAGLICTTILERGVTFEGIDVCVWHADHPTFSEASLVQIAGRVGRKASRPTGECLFLSFSKSESVDKSIRMIEYANSTKMSFVQ